MNTTTIPVTARPTKSDAAKMLKVDKSTLGRHVTSSVEAGRSHHLTACEILDLNERFKRRDRHDLAKDIVTYAKDNDADYARAVQAEIVEWFRGFNQANPLLPKDDRSASIEETFRSLSRGLDPSQVSAVRELIDRVASGERLESFVSDDPDED